MRPGRRIALAVVATLLLVLTPGAAAETLEDLGSSVHKTIPLALGEWHAFRTTMNAIESLRIDVRVTQGGAIDVYTTDEFGFGEYTDPNATEFRYYSEGSSINSTSMSASFPPPTGGDYYVILDNTRITSDGANPTGPVTVDVSIEKTSLLLLLLVVFGGIASVGIAVPLIIRSRRRKRRAARPRPTEGPQEPPRPPSE